MSISRMLVLLLLTSLASCVPASAPRADLVVRNARVWTADASHQWAEAIAIQGNRIVAVGSNEEIGRRSGAGTEVIDAKGKLADLVLLSQDLFKIESMDIHKTRVVLTIFDGKVIYK